MLVSALAPMVMVEVLDAVGEDVRARVLGESGVGRVM